MSPDTTLSFVGGYLRVLRPGNAHPGYVSGLADPEVSRYLDVARRVKQTTLTVTDFISKNINSEDSVLWGIWQAEADHHCGTVRLHGIDSFHKTAHIGVCLFEKEIWGKGLGSKAINAVTRWALDDLELRWIEAAAYAENIASQRAFLRAGYKWVYDIPGKYLLDNLPATVKIFVLQR